MPNSSTAALLAAVASALALLAPPPPLKISEWADRTVILSREESAEPGPWRTARAPYLREMMDCLNDPDTETAVYQIASQLGKTACMMNVIFYFAHNDPSPILFVLPTQKQMESLSKERIAPRIEASPAIKGVFADPKARDSGNTTLNKKFLGGYLAMVGANQPRDLASRSCRILIADEIDGMVASAGVEGEPIVLIDARATNFWNRRKVYGSTPTIKDASRVEALYLRSDRRKYMVPCPQCGTFQVLEFERLCWPGPHSDPKRTRHQVEDCYYVCEQGCEIREHDKPAMVAQGHWERTNPHPEDPKVAGFQMSTMYSPWFKWPEMAQAYINCFRDPQLKQADDRLLKVFTNTRLGRTFEQKGETVDDSSLLKRRTVYEARVPLGALVLTAGVDVQGNRIECEVVGWGVNERSWSIDYFILKGNPSMPDLWLELDRVLRATYRHASGAQMRIQRTFVDSGNNTKRVYWYCRPREGRGVYACKGIDGFGASLIRPRAQNRVHRGSVDLRLIGVDTGKEALYANLKEEGATGYCAFPSGYRDETGQLVRLENYDKEYFEQLTAEKLVTEMDGMTPVRKWIKQRERNEALDCRVYAMAALEDLNVDWKRLAKNMGRIRRPAPEAHTGEDEQGPALPVRDRSSKVTRKAFRLPGMSWVRG